MENNSKFTKIALTILLILLLGYSTYATYTIIDLRNDIKNFEKENNENNDNQSNDTDTPDTQDQNASDDNSLKEYTHPNYPELKIKYYEDWIIDIDETQIDYIILTEDSKTVNTKASQLDITLKQDSVTIQIASTPTEMWGTAGGTAYKYDEKEIVILNENWVRIQEDDSYYYAPKNNITFRNEDPQDFKEFFEMIYPETFEGKEDEYDYIIYEEAGTIISSYKHDNFHQDSFALSSIRLVIEGESNEEVIKEADQIIMQSNFAKQSSD